jgi:hypothetical protein
MNRPGTRKDGTRPTTYGTGPKGDTTMPRGPGPSAKRKGGMPAARSVENKPRGKC